MILPDGSERIHDPTRYGRDFAEIYDLFEAPGPEDTAATVRKLAELAMGRPVLEVAAGTGRIAIPLAQTGLEVTATDASEDMLRVLRKRDVKKLVHTTVDVLPNISGDERYGLICIVINSIWVMLKSEEQRAFLHNVAEHLDPDGLLVVEMGVANPMSWRRPRVFPAGEGSAIRHSTWNPVSQIFQHQITLKKSGGVYGGARDVVGRALFPNELLLMAELEGLRADDGEIWSDWEEGAFGPDSKNMITVFRQA